MRNKSPMLFAAFVALAPALAAAQSAQPVRVEQACKAELTSLCAGSADKRGGATRCLNDNQAKLGAECAGAIKAAQARREALQAACKADADKLCATTAAPKGGQIVTCLRGKLAEVSKPCADAIAALPPPAAKE